MLPPPKEEPVLELPKDPEEDLVGEVLKEVEEPEVEADPLKVDPVLEEVDPLKPEVDPPLEKEVEGEDGEPTKPPPLLLPPDV